MIFLAQPQNVGPVVVGLYHKLSWYVYTCIYPMSSPQQDWPNTGYAKDIAGGGEEDRGAGDPPNGPDMFDVFRLPRHPYTFLDQKNPI